MNFNIKDIVDYAYCPYYYKLNKENKDISTVIELYDNVMHKSIYAYLTSIQNNSVPSLNTLYSSFGTQWIGKNKNIEDILFTEPSSWRDRKNIKRKQGFDALYHFHHRMSKHEFIPIFINKKYSFNLTSNITIEGNLELVRDINGLIEIIDFKTNDRDINEVYVESSLELTAMDYALKNLFNITANSLVVYNVEKNRAYLTRRDDSSFKEFKSNVINICKGIHNNIFYKSYSNDCNSCKFKSKCKQGI